MMTTTVPTDPILEFLLLQVMPTPQTCAPTLGAKSIAKEKQA